MTTEPASIRFNNPGAMWGGNAIAKRWGATATIALNDGLGQGNTIAFFPSKVAGAAAQFDLWRSNYCNMSLDAATRKWSGGNSSPPYILFLKQRTGLDPSTVITGALLAGNTGWQLMKAQAQWESGVPYPLSDAEWKQAQLMCFSGTTPLAPKPKLPKKTGGAIIVATGGAAAGAAHQAGLPIPVIILIGVAVAGLAAFLFWKFKSN